MPELDAEADTLAGGAEEGGDAFTTAAALGVGITPEGRHGLEGTVKELPEGFSTTGVVDGPLETRDEAGGTGGVSRPGGRTVAVVVLDEGGEEGTGAGRAGVGAVGAGGVGTSGIGTSGSSGRRGVGGLGDGDLGAAAVDRLATELDPGAIGPAGVAEPAEVLEVLEIGAQHVGLQMP